MPVVERNGIRIWQRRDRGRQLAIWGGWLAGTLVFVESLRFISGQTIWEFAMDAHTQAWDLATRMVPPRWSYMDKLWLPLWDTLNIATLGTVLGTLIAFPIAFLAARIQVKFDSEFPRFSQSLLETVYPQYLSPVPSMTVVRFSPDEQASQLVEGFTIPRGTALRSNLGRNDRTACEYRTAQDVVLWPVLLAEAQYYTRDVGQLHLPGQRDVARPHPLPCQFCDHRAQRLPGLWGPR